MAGTIHMFSNVSKNMAGNIMKVFGVLSPLQVGRLFQSLTQCRNALPSSTLQSLQASSESMATLIKQIDQIEQVDRPSSSSKERLAAVQWLLLGTLYTVDKMGDNSLQLLRSIKDVLPRTVNLLKCAQAELETSKILKMLRSYARVIYKRARVGATKDGRQ
ncbi:hypothetical protein KP509_23G054900 [Ceratopteris richardii]|uniref:Uncharacterized protein n=1 Tax=Ceratopteris richardii TaxID=49495 RepID=A0A8T2S338_CERRI|nr:hypothetical protein KP509_23G054900 [Ceratopteris richardii]